MKQNSMFVVGWWFGRLTGLLVSDLGLQRASWMTAIHLLTTVRTCGPAWRMLGRTFVHPRAWVLARCREQVVVWVTCTRVGHRLKCTFSSSTSCYDCVDEVTTAGSVSCCYLACVPTGDVSGVTNIDAVGRDHADRKCNLPRPTPFGTHDQAPSYRTVADEPAFVRQRWRRDNFFPLATYVLVVVGSTH